jgi:hypothetical protein
MSEPKHTPGPWAYADPELWENADGVVIGTAADDDVEAFEICEVCELPRAERNANVRLIAAAPDLLAACEEAAEALESSEYRSDQRTRGRLLAAIARAKGV